MRYVVVSFIGALLLLEEAYDSGWETVHTQEEDELQPTQGDSHHEGFVLDFGNGQSNSFGNN